MFSSYSYVRVLCCKMTKDMSFFNCFVSLPVSRENFVFLLFPIWSKQQLIIFLFKVLCLTIYSIYLFTWCSWHKLFILQVKKKHIILSRDRPFSAFPWETDSPKWLQCTGEHFCYWGRQYKVHNFRFNMPFGPKCQKGRKILFDKLGYHESKMTVGWWEVVFRAGRESTWFSI